MYKELEHDVTSRFAGGLRGKNARARGCGGRGAPARESQDTPQEAIEAMARLKKRASKGSDKTTMYDKKINGRDKAKAMAKSKGKRVVESDSGSGERRLRLTPEMKLFNEMIDNFNPPKRAEDCKPSLAAFLVYHKNNMVEGPREGQNFCPALYDEAFQYYHRHFGRSNFFKIYKQTADYKPRREICTGCGPCIFGRDVVTTEQAALMGYFFQAS
jgi:hypothetical protein